MFFLSFVRMYCAPRVWAIALGLFVVVRSVLQAAIDAIREGIGVKALELGGSWRTLSLFTTLDGGEPSESEMSETYKRAAGRTVERECLSLEVPQPYSTVQVYSEGNTTRGFL